MPHLSPMGWLSSMLMFWLSVSLLMSMLWWSEMHSFNSEMHSNSMNNPNTWKWLLQDGRVMNIKL